MALKISGSKSSSRRLPATYQVLFTGTPKAGEVREAQGKVEKSMRRDNAKKRKNKGHSRERVIQIIAIMERFFSEIKELQYLIYMTFFKVQ